MSSNKIISFQQEKERIALKNCEYEGTVKIYVEGKAFEGARYLYTLQNIEKEYLERFLLLILNSLIERLVQSGSNLRIEEATEHLLNKEIIIDYYSSKYGDKFFFEHSPKEITDSQLIVILNSCIADLRQS